MEYVIIAKNKLMSETYGVIESFRKGWKASGSMGVIEKQAFRFILG